MLNQEDKKEENENQTINMNMEESYPAKKKKKKHRIKRHSPQYFEQIRMHQLQKKRVYFCVR